MERGKLPSGYVHRVRLFLGQPHSPFPSSEWLECELLKCYMRRSWCTIPGTNTRVSAIVVSNVEVFLPHRRQGLFSSLLELFDKCAQGRVVYVENVLDLWQRGIYLRRGFIEISPPQIDNVVDTSVCFYKLPKEEHE